LSTFDIVNRIKDSMETTTPTPPKLEAESPGAEAWALLRTLFGQHRRRFLIAATEFDLHPAQAGALLQLASPLPMHALATLLACDSSNVTGIIDRLEARGLVARRPSPDDRRVKHVVLTPAGRRLRARLLDRVGRPSEGLERLSAEEQRQLRDLLRRMLADHTAPESGESGLSRRR
jgi:MarR family transcriptional regulator, organic hydroperoxide resistance regulator